MKKRNFIIGTMLALAVSTNIYATNSESTWQEPNYMAYVQDNEIATRESFVILVNDTFNLK